MKQKLRLWVYYALLEALFITTILTSSMCADARAQRPEPSGPAPGFLNPPQGLVIGDSVPEWFWDTKLSLVYPDSMQTFDFSAHKDKLLVLDFWGAFCAPCVASLDKWDSLQSVFPDDVAVV